MSLCLHLDKPRIMPCICSFPTTIEIILSFHLPFIICKSYILCRSGDRLHEGLSAFKLMPFDLIRLVCTFEENETGVQRNEVLESFLDAPCPAAVLHLDLDSGGNVTGYNSLMNS